MHLVLDVRLWEPLELQVRIHQQIFGLLVQELKNLLVNDACIILVVDNFFIQILAPLLLVKFLSVSIVFNQASVEDAAIV